MSGARRHKRRWTVEALRWAGVVLGATLVAVLVRRAFIEKNVTIVGDGQNFIRFWETARTSMQRGDGFPLWDRSQCAGHPWLSNPETGLLSSLIVGWLGVHGDAMQRWWPVLGEVVAITGVYAWCKRALALSDFAALFSGALWGASGFVAVHFSGHMSFVPFALVPWVLAVARAGEESLRGAVGVGLLLALMSLEGGVYPVPFALVALAACEAPRLLRRHGARRVVRLALVAGGVLSLVAAVRIVPTLALLGRHPRALAETDSLAWTELLPMLLDRDRFGGFAGHRYVWDEYRGYIGPLALGMAIAGTGVAVLLRPRRWDLVLLLLVATLLTRGMATDAAPYALLRALPIFRQLRVPSRFIVLVTLALAAAAGVALDAARRFVGRRPLALLVVAIGVVAVADPIVVEQATLAKYADQPWLPRPDPPYAPYRLEWGSDANRSAEYPARNAGMVVCYKTWDLPEGTGYALGDRPQVTVSPPDAGTISSQTVRQNAYEVDAALTRPATLRLNQNFDPDWKSNVGRTIRTSDGQLAVELPAGRHHVVARYRPAGLSAGIALSILGVLVAAALWVWNGRRPRSSPPSASRPRYGAEGPGREARA